MTRQTWTAAIAALLFVVAAGFIALTPVPYVTYAPGLTYDVLGGGEQPTIRVEGIPTYPSAGELRVAPLHVTDEGSPVSLPELLYAHWAPDREVYPRDAVYPRGVTSAAPAGVTSTRAQAVQDAKTAQANAAAAALRAAGQDVRQIPMVQTVASTGPAADKLRPGDFVLAVDGVSTPTIAAVNDQIAARGIGTAVTFTVLRDGEALDVTFDTTQSRTNPNAAVWGGSLERGYAHAPRVSFDLDQVSDVPSAGLVLGLGVFDRVTPGDLLGGRVVAGAGLLDGAGNVGAVSGVRERLAAADQSGAEIFLAPAANCGDLEGIDSRVRVVSVASLDDAISALDALADPSTQGMVRGCA